MVANRDAGARKRFAHGIGRDAEARCYFIGGLVAIFFHGEHGAFAFREVVHHYLFYVAESIAVFSLFGHMSVGTIGATQVERNHRVPLVAAMQVDGGVFHLGESHGLRVVGVADVVAMCPQRAERILKGIFGILIVIEQTTGIAA